MEYERIHKVQTGTISPSKLRMKLMGPHHPRKKEGSNSNSSRTSPSKLEDSELVKNSLLASETRDLDEEAPSIDVSSAKFPKDDACNLGAILPGHVRNSEDENLDYDSNASSSSFEFHNGDRCLHTMRSFSRPVPSKWNDAEKWILNRQIAHSNNPRRSLSQGQANRVSATNMVRVVPELAGNRTVETKRVDFYQPILQTQLGFEKYDSIPAALSDGANSCPQSTEFKEPGCMELTPLSFPAQDTEGIPAIKSISMRDMGTEMTPIASQEPSRTATPERATSPFRSPTSSIPSTPRREVPAPSPVEGTIGSKTCPRQNSNIELSDLEMKLKTRREIVALGVQLGKMSIAAWASNEEREKNASSNKMIDFNKLNQIEFGTRAAAWEEAEKSKHVARYKREEIRIHAWESQEKAKAEAVMRRIEAQVEHMRSRAQAKMVKKIAMVRQRSEEKLAAAEARKNRQVEKAAAEAEYIRQTGQIPSPYICCGWLR